MSQPVVPMRMRDKVILRVVGRTLIPLIVLFGLYVQFHGDFGPGGGFQAGVIIAAGFVLYGLIYGLEALQALVPIRALEVAVSLGVLLYAGVGLLTIALGGNFLDYNAIDPHHPAHGQHMGILMIEAGVGSTVTSAMLGIYYMFAGRS